MFETTKLLFHCYFAIQLFMNDIVLINRNIKMFSHLGVVQGFV